jgi:serine/threonine protein kinase
MSRFSVVSACGELRVEQKPLGTGGQGEVYRAEWNGRSFAFKLYHRQSSTIEQRRALERLVAKKTESLGGYFLWPLHIVEDHEQQRFGYLMELREPRFRKTEDIMARRVQASFGSLLRASLQLSDAFAKLHTSGLCYRDISFGNIFIDPQTGDIRICDNDNVDIQGAATGGVIGTPRFMAPEVVRGDAQPSDQTDRYSLSVLLFYLLLSGHPLDGAREAQIRCLDTPAMNKLYGSDPLYIFDPKDASNRPVRGVHDNPIIFSQIYPEMLMKCFTRAFTDGLHNPGNRIREPEWRKVFSQLYDLLVRCPSCHKTNFFEPGSARRSCWGCRAVLPVSALLRLPESSVALQPGTKLYAHHVRRDAFNFKEVLAEVSAHPQNPGLWGLKNLTDETWTVSAPDGSLRDVPPGRSVSLRNDLRVHFGRVDALVEFPSTP